MNNEITLDKIVVLENEENIESVFNELAKSINNPEDYMYMETVILGKNTLRHRFKHYANRNVNITVRTQNKMFKETT